MKRYLCVPALLAIGIGAVELGFLPAHAQGSQPDYRRAVIQSLQLAKVQRVVLKRLAAAERQLAPCFDRLATDERLEADLLPLIARAIPTPERAQPILAFLATPAGKKFGVAVERREPEFKPAMGRTMILPGGVPMSANELTTDELREIDGFL